MTHVERAQRRRLVATYVETNGADNAAVSKAAISFGLGLETVRKCCREFRVVVRNSRHDIHNSTLKIIADLINTRATQVELAKRYGVSHQWVSDIYTRAKAAGIPVEPRSGGDRK